MKVRRKSEIAEAVQWDGTAQIILGVTLGDYREGMWMRKNDWIVKIGNEPPSIYSSETFSAHYEPVPEPPAAEVPCRCDVEMFGKHCDDCPNAWAEAREERERSVGGIDPQRIAQTNHNIKEQLKTAAPYRATIAVIPCICTCGNFVIEIDGVIVREETGSFWFGTEAEAQAKANELRNA